MLRARLCVKVLTSLRAIEISPTFNLLLISNRSVVRMVTYEFGICHEGRGLAYGHMISHASSSVGTQCSHSGQFSSASTDTTITSFARVTCSHS